MVESTEIFKPDSEKLIITSLFLISSVLFANGITYLQENSEIEDIGGELEIGVPLPYGEQVYQCMESHSESGGIQGCHKRIQFNFIESIVNLGFWYLISVIGVESYRRHLQW